MPQQASYHNCCLLCLCSHSKPKEGTQCHNACKEGITFDTQCLKLKPKENAPRVGEKTPQLVFFHNWCLLCFLLHSNNVTLRAERTFILTLNACSWMHELLYRTTVAYHNATLVAWTNAPSHCDTKCTNYFTVPVQCDIKLIYHWENQAKFWCLCYRKHECLLNSRVETTLTYCCFYMDSWSMSVSYICALHVDLHIQSFARKTVHSVLGCGSVIHERGSFAHP